MDVIGVKITSFSTGLACQRLAPGANKSAGTMLLTAHERCFLRMPASWIADMGHSGEVARTAEERIRKLGLAYVIYDWTIASHELDRISNDYSG
ncbi:hypothetical protein FJW08_13850 [Mesorhizobium sp. B3-2-1]|uniref:hypothetical protein n=1 Tax=Mesorhizobium sp. B3-2-1 TaxID=2589891 RepID=UPI001127F69F|nr:hypothetical protein [Mesorhizobium sp. B3-2-1]TPI30695.1 hypothetical protein FJW08_13850 [Mesorhizobium sp. B3-2-1]